MRERVYVVHCTWDAEAAVWVVESDDVPGLATGADTLDALVDSRVP
jgi:predicted RNase H-like HicB family nuclease